MRRKDNLADLPGSMCYGISQVYYDKGGRSHIDMVRVHEVADAEDQEVRCRGCLWRTADVVARLKEGDRFVTLPAGRKKTPFGQPVHVFRGEFIRSFPNANPNDNLESLPRLSTTPQSSYGISWVHNNGTHIDLVKVHSVKDQKKLCPGCLWRSADVVARLREPHPQARPQRSSSGKHDPFVTLPETGIQGRPIRIFRSNGIRSAP
jgi:hypothetical protein